jgi:hypothetical protein
MFVHKPARLLCQPCIKRCCGCGDLGFAVASQALVHQPSGQTRFRWICESCGKKRGLYPTAEYLSKKWVVQRGADLEIKRQVRSPHREFAHRSY